MANDGQPVIKWWNTNDQLWEYLTSIDYQKHANESNISPQRVHLTILMIPSWRLAVIKKTNNNQDCRGCGQKRTLLGDMQISLTTIIINMKVPQETRSGCIWCTIWHSSISTVCLPKRPQRVYQRYLHNMFMEALLTVTKLWNKSLYPTRTTIKENRVIKNKFTHLLKNRWKYRQY